MMDDASFEDLIDRYGGDLARWPARARIDAQALLAASPAARAMLAEMREVEAALRTPFAVSSPAAVDRIASHATRHAQETRARRLALRAGIGTAAAAVLALGVLVGGLLPPPAAHDMSADRVLAAALGSGGASDVE